MIFWLVVRLSKARAHTDKRVPILILYLDHISGKLMHLLHTDRYYFFIRLDKRLFNLDSSIYVRNEIPTYNTEIGT